MKMKGQCTSPAHVRARNKEGRYVGSQDTSQVETHSMHLSGEVRLFYFVLRLSYKYFTFHMGAHLICLYPPLFLAHIRHSNTLIKIQFKRSFWFTKFTSTLWWRRLWKKNVTHKIFVELNILTRNVQKSVMKP